MRKCSEWLMGDKKTLGMHSEALMDEKDTLTGHSKALANDKDTLTGPEKPLNLNLKSLMLQTIPLAP